MIPESIIIDWRNHVPWQSFAQVEQDLVICRALIEIFNNAGLKDKLAFRGGTALHKLFLKPQARYSEDIDLVQIKAEPIGEVLGDLRKALAFLGKPSVSSTDSMSTMRFGFQTEMAPVITMKLKIETNCREHFNELGFLEKDFEVNSDWFSGKCKIQTYQLEELLGTKLRALYQRRKGRDLYDLYKALSVNEVDDDLLIQCYKRYMAFSVNNPPSQREFILNMDEKINDRQFDGDITALLRQGEDYDQLKAYELIKQRLLSKI